MLRRWHDHFEIVLQLLRSRRTDVERLDALSRSERCNACDEAQQDVRDRVHFRQPPFRPRQPRGI
jgi:hypothetical protein